MKHLLLAIFVAVGVALAVEDRNQPPTEETRWDQAKAQVVEYFSTEKGRSQDVVRTAGEGAEWIGGGWVKALPK